MISRHQSEGLWGQQPGVAQRPTTEQHAAELQVVSRGRHQAAAAGYKARRIQKRALGRIILKLLATLAVGGIARREARRLISRHVEAGVDHTERIKEAFLEELLERLPGKLADDLLELGGRDSELEVVDRGE